MTKDEAIRVAAIQLADATRAEISSEEADRERDAILALIGEIEAEHRRYAEAEKDPRWEAVAATLAILRDRIGRGEHRK